MPVGIVELGKVVRVLHVLHREPRLQPAREVEHLLRLELLDRDELALDRVPARAGRRRLVRLGASSVATSRPRRRRSDRLGVLDSRATVAPRFGTDAEAVRLRHPDLARPSRRARDLALQRVVERVTALAAPRTERRALAPVRADEEVKSRSRAPLASPAFLARNCGRTAAHMRA